MASGGGRGTGGGGVLSSSPSSDSAIVAAKPQTASASPTSTAAAVGVAREAATKPQQPRKQKQQQQQQHQQQMYFIGNSYPGDFPSTTTVAGPPGASLGYHLYDYSGASTYGDTAMGGEQFEEYPRYVLESFVEGQPQQQQPIYGENGGLYIHHPDYVQRYGYTAQAPHFQAYSPSGPIQGPDGQLYSPQQFHYSAPHMFSHQQLSSVTTQYPPQGMTTQLTAVDSSSGAVPASTDASSTGTDGTSGGPGTSHVSSVNARLQIQGQSKGQVHGLPRMPMALIHHPASGGPVPPGGFGRPVLPVAFPASPGAADMLSGPPQMHVPVLLQQDGTGVPALIRPPPMNPVVSRMGHVTSLPGSGVVRGPMGPGAGVGMSTATAMQRTGYSPTPPSVKIAGNNGVAGLATRTARLNLAGERGDVGITPRSWQNGDRLKPRRGGAQVTPVNNGTMNGQLKDGGGQIGSSGDGMERTPRLHRPIRSRGAAGMRHLRVGGEGGNSSRELREQFNRPDFNCKPDMGRFFVIKSYSEDDVHKSIKFNVWASTPNGNRRLETAFKESLEKGGRGVCPVFFFFSVNASGQFLGVAEMAGAVNFEQSVDYWQQDKWSGQFPVHWHLIKDIPNGNFRHIILENNDNKPVTNSRDTQEIQFEQGIEMLSIFKNFPSKTSILDDFDFYDNRQKQLQEKKARQAQQRQRDQQHQGAPKASYLGPHQQHQLFHNQQPLSTHCPALAVPKRIDPSALAPMKAVAKISEADSRANSVQQLSLLPDPGSSSGVSFPVLEEVRGSATLSGEGCGLSSTSSGDMSASDMAFSGIPLSRMMVNSLVTEASREAGVAAVDMESTAVAVENVLSRVCSVKGNAVSTTEGMDIAGDQSAAESDQSTAESSITLVGGGVESRTGLKLGLLTDENSVSRGVKRGN